MAAEGLYSVAETMSRLAVDEQELKSLIKARKLYLVKHDGGLYCRAEEVDALQTATNGASSDASVDDEPIDITLDDIDAEEDALGEPLSLVEEPKAAAKADDESKVSYVQSSLTGGEGVVDTSNLRRSLIEGTNATRCRTFHCKLSDAAMAYMNRQVNDWIDGTDGIEIKFASSTIGVVEGKHAESHLILTVFY